MSSQSVHAFPPLTTASPQLLLPLIFVNLADVLQTRELISQFCKLKEIKLEHEFDPALNKGQGLLALE